jgi:hypothetical protein
MSLLNKIDIPRDQVFVESTIMELIAGDSQSFGLNYFKFLDNKGISRVGFGDGNVASLADVTASSGLLLGFAQGGSVKLNVGGKEVEVKDTLGFINILKSILGKNMQAVLLYGSATNSEKFADYDLIIIVKDLKDALENLAGKSPKYNGLEINISVFDEKDFWTYQLASGDNLMDHAICLYGEARIPHKASNDLLARNFSFGFIRFRQLLGMAAQLNNSPTESDDKRNLLNYFTKIPLNVSKGIQGCYGKVTTNEEIRKWFITKLQFNVDEQIENSKKTE